MPNWKEVNEEIQRAGLDANGKPDPIKQGQALNNVRRRYLEVLCMHHPVLTPKPVYRTMARSWGSFTSSGTLVLNTDLIQAPVICIRSIVLHELCHLVHHDHGNEFYSLIGRVMRDWKRCKEWLEEGY